jgi:hypothetical protein
LNRRPVRAAVLFLALLLAGSACSVSTQITVAVLPGGSGTVTVVVSFAPSALSSVGGLGALRSDLDLAGLSAAGWTVRGPDAASGGRAVLTATHGFASPTDLSAVMASIAGPGVFEAHLAVHKGFWSTSYQLSGSENLSCGLSCFGDAGLRQSTGSPTGVTPPSGAAANFRFGLSARLPGQASSSWVVPLGGVEPITLADRVQDRARRVEVAVGGVVVVVVLAVLGGVGLVRRRARRAAPASSPAAGADAGSSPSAGSGAGSAPAASSPAAGADVWSSPGAGPSEGGEETVTPGS